MMDEMGTALPIAQVAEIRYCPRNFYYRIVEGADDVNEHVLQGQWEDERRMDRMTVRRESGLQVRSVVVESGRLGICGVIDVLEEAEVPCIVEFKKGSLRDNLSDDIQVCLQAMSWEEMTGQHMSFGYVYYHASHRRREVILSDELREAAADTVLYGRTILQSGQVPEAVNDARCDGCSLRSRCLPEESIFLRSQGPANRVRRPTPSVNLGRVLYVDDPGAYVRKDGRRLKIVREGETVRELPVDSIDEVVSGASVQWSSAALQLLFLERIPLAFVTQQGRYVGQVQPRLTRNGTLRMKQYEFRCSLRRDELCKGFLMGKIINMRVMMLRHDRSSQDEQRALQAEGLVKEVLRKLPQGKSREELLGFEGLASRAYFQRFATWLYEPFVFAGRVRRPPRDPVNALLSLGYSLLAKSMEASIEMVGLDPYIGFLHETVYGRPALALDMMEEFRAIIVDSIVLRAVNQRMIDLADFEQSEYGVHLKEKGRKVFYRLYEQRMKEEITHPLFQYRVTYRRMIELQVRFLAKVIMGELEHYTPLTVR